MKKDKFDNYSRNSEGELLEKLKSHILKNKQELLKEIKDDFKQNNINNLISNLETLFELQKFFSDQFPAIKHDYLENLKVLESLFFNKRKKLLQILKIKTPLPNIHENESSYNHLEVIINFFEKNNSSYYDKLKKPFQDVTLELEKFLRVAQSLIIKINLDEKFNINQIIQSIKTLNALSRLVDKIMNSNYISNDDTCCLRTYDDLLVEFSFKLSSYLNELHSFAYLKYDNNNKWESNFDNFYERLNSKLEFLNEIKLNLQPYLKAIFNFEDYESNFISSVKENLTNFNNKLYENFDILLNASSQNETLLNEFNTALYNLRSFNKLFYKKLANSAHLKIDSNEVIKGKLFKKFSEVMAQLSENVETKNIEDAASAFLKIKKMGNVLLLFKSEVDDALDSLLNKYINKNGFASVGRLAMALKEEPIGNVIVAEHKAFLSYHRSLFNKKTSNQKIDNVLNEIKGDLIDIDKLKEAYKSYEEKFQELIQKYLKPNLDLDGFISNLKIKINRIKPILGKHNKIDWENNIIDELPDLIAHLFSLWTLLNSNDFFNLNEKRFLFSAHPAQVIAIFRMLGLGFSDASNSKKTNQKNNFKKNFEINGLRNNLVEIGTGEGKSITLGITAATLALLGFDVKCVCYSSYLSNRDFTAFKLLFDRLNLTEFIKYGTFAMISEDVINENGNLRQLVENILLEKPINIDFNEQKNRPSVLLIDEVDVFFSKDFYGNRYNPISSLKDETITKLIEFIWKNKNGIAGLSLDVVQKSEEYTNCIRKFKKCTALIDKSINKIITDFLEFSTSNHNTEYKIIDDMIGYIYQDEYTFSTYKGYYTLYAYFLEHEYGKISKESLNKQIGLNISLGSYSYAEIPKTFNAILGVSGTLRSLNDAEIKVIRNEYDINYMTFMPSVYGRNNLVFNEMKDVLIENDTNHFKVISREIDNRIKGKIQGTKRAVLVVFENKAELNKFNNSDEFLPFKQNSSILSEEVNNVEKKVIITSATFSGKVTLLTKIFGRGTDFIVFDEIVSANGGVHVIHTFLSEELSEEIQIKGRAARQGEDGSYGMIIAKSSLEKFNIGKNLFDKPNELYDLLNNKRNIFSKQSYEKNIKYVSSIKEKHYKSAELINHIYKSDRSKINDYLLKAN